ncbi:elongation factor P maturation arginine rhamnosyltransferase EarP [Entomospira nematocerorum]|uniref:Protein-arginine rhamnosyltransferase n=1 Tax=Entomospira nematocerorum TaxID=2719987 RepID=A0A968GHH0_9SPIO|nr:elongation factor P maturation arginine rhamnosyltransferase EarP [Entomospira nematocera]NIZ47226.1 elongation factor P maturation arginine rhamnosyltransferase EarP [Entomospira nematocera]WDI34232.1 elongation factor P maturation arginine rhamnosyltransferase EarP [Entomospira nematocera]
MKIDIFCHVIDYFGDVAVAYRLARAMCLHQDDLSIRFFCTHPEIIAHLYPHAETLPITIHEYNTSLHLDRADVAIESFACELPIAYEKPTLIINLEYLTAEEWITSYHRLESIGMNPSGKKFFFFPSIDNQAGSLTHGDFLFHKTTWLDHHTHYKQDLIHILNLPPHFLDRPWILIYIYTLDTDSWNYLASHFSIIHIDSKAAPITSPWIVTRRCPQQAFDMLITLCDMLIIRGEDSLSRAILAGKPFLWQAYKQEENYHLIKVRALCQLLQQTYPANTWALWQEAILALNADNTILAKTLQQLIANTSLFQQTANKITQYRSLEENLLNFIEQKQHNSST